MGSGTGRKGPSRVLTVSSTTHDYQEAAHLPWSEIEARVRHHFSEEARQAIFDARQDYVESLDAYRSAPTAKQVNDLLKNILSQCRELHRIAVVVDQSNEPGTEEFTMERAFDGLVTKYIESDFRHRFRSLSDRCLEIEGILSAEPSEIAVVTKSSPAHVMAFDNLYERLAQARSALGFPATENTPRFIRLVSWIAASAGESADAETVKGARRRRRNAIGRKGGK